MVPPPCRAGKVTRAVTEPKRCDLHMAAAVFRTSRAPSPLRRFLADFSFSRSGGLGVTAAIVPALRREHSRSGQPPLRRADDPVTLSSASVVCVLRLVPEPAECRLLRLLSNRGRNRNRKRPGNVQDGSRPVADYYPAYLRNRGATVRVFKPLPATSVARMNG